MFPVPGEDWDCALILGSHQEHGGGRQAVCAQPGAEPGSSRGPRHPHLAVRYCKKSGCSSLNFSADASGPKYFCGLQRGEEKDRICIMGVLGLLRVYPPRDRCGVRAGKSCSLR